MAPTDVEAALPLAIRRRPPNESLRWVVDAIGDGARITSMRRLRGGASSAMHAINVVDSRGHRYRMVLRRYVRANWLELEPDLAEREARVLQLLQRTGIPTPELVAVDGDGHLCDVPAVLMTRLPGRVTLAPDDVTSWLSQIAATLPAIHGVDTSGYAVQPYQTYNDPRELRPPRWSKRASAWEQVLKRLAGPAPEAPRCFIHRDYHPGNLLWSHDRLAGVIDWTNASIGPPGIDVGHCRLNLVTLYGREMADRFLGIYLNVAGRHASHDPYWDAISAIEFLPDPEVFPGWRELGLTGLTTALIRSRLDDYVASIAARL